MSLGSWRKEQLKAREQRIEKLLREGLSNAVIQDRTGATLPVIARVAKAIGVKPRRDTQQKIKGLWL